MDTSLTDLQADLVERLKSDEFFADIPVLDERKSDLASDIELALGTLTEAGGKLGICAVVLSPVANDELPDVVFGPLEVELSVLVLENVLLNTGPTGTGKAALTVARRIHRILKHYRAVGLGQALVPAKQSIIPVDNPLAPLAYEVRFATTEADREVNSKVAMPTISPDGGAVPQTVSLACTTAGASIYFTLDGSYPRAGNSAATLYVAPFELMSAGTLRAAAFKSGYIASDVNSAKFS